MSDYYAHESAIVDEGAVVGHGCRIWHFTHVSSGAQIGNNVTLGQNVFVGGNARIGDGCKVQNNVSVFDGIELESEVFCGPSVVFTNVYNPRAGIERKSEYRKTIVRHGATLGANATVLCGVSVGRFAFIAAGAVVRTDVPDYALFAGVPAAHIGWMSEYGERMDLPKSGSGTYTCPHAGVKYELDGNQVITR